MTPENIKPTAVSYPNFVSIARDLIEITDTILRNVMTETEKAALSIGEKIQTISALSDEQASSIKELLTKICTQGTDEQREMESVTRETNEVVDRIVESARNGDLDMVRKLGDSERYASLKQRSGSLVKQLERMVAQDQMVGEILGPVIMALQFQDSVRQSLENIVRTFEIFFHAVSCISHEKLPPGLADGFWERVEGQFTSTKDRNIVREVIRGKDAVSKDDLESGDPVFL